LVWPKSADGRGDPRPIVRFPRFHWLIGWTPDGTLAFGTLESPSPDGMSRTSIQAIGGGVTRQVMRPGETWGGRLSSDGRWLAYYLRESGDFEVYVSPFQNTGTRWLSADGNDPSWSPDGKELYYGAATG